MRAPGVVEADPVSNEAGRVLDAFEAVTALLLERADRALDHADLLRAVRGDGKRFLGGTFPVFA